MWSIGLKPDQTACSSTDQPFSAAYNQVESMYNHLKLVLAGFCQPCGWSKVVYQV